MTKQIRPSSAAMYHLRSSQQTHCMLTSQLAQQSKLHTCLKVSKRSNPFYLHHFISSKVEDGNKTCSDNLVIA